MDFPDDGYNYAQHLRTAGSGTFLPRAGLESFFNKQQQARFDKSKAAAAATSSSSSAAAEGTDAEPTRIILPRHVVALDDALEKEHLEEAYQGTSSSLSVASAAAAASALLTCAPPA